MRLRLCKSGLRDGETRWMERSVKAAFPDTASAVSVPRRVAEGGALSPSGARAGGEREADTEAGVEMRLPPASVNERHGIARNGAPEESKSGCATRASEAAGPMNTENVGDATLGSEEESARFALLGIVAENVSA